MKTKLISTYLTLQNYNGSGKKMSKRQNSASIQGRGSLSRFKKFENWNNEMIDEDELSTSSSWFYGKAKQIPADATGYTATVLHWLQQAEDGNGSESLISVAK